MQETLNKIVMEFEETREDFIFKTIYPYCLHITEQKMSKERLKKLLLLGLEKEKEIAESAEGIELD